MAGGQVGQHRVVPRGGGGTGPAGHLPQVGGQVGVAGVLQGRFQVGQEAAHILVAVGLAHRQALHDDVADGHRAGRLGGGGGGQQVAVHPLHGVVGRLAHDAPVEGGGQGIDIGPGALVALAAVLFLGGVAGLEDHRQALDIGLGHRPRGAEVQQLGAAVGQHHDVVGADIPVDDAVGVHPLQRAHHRHEQGHGVGGSQTPLLFQVVLQGDAVQEVHDDVGGAVLLTEIPHPHDTGLLVEPGQHPGLAEEFLLVFREGVPVGAQGGKHRVGSVVVAVHVARHVEFLDGHLQVEHGVPAHIGDAETALAQHAAHLVPLFDQAARHQMMGQYGVAGAVKAAPGADAFLPQRRQTVGADPHFTHIRSSFALSACPCPRIPGRRPPPPRRPRCAAGSSPSCPPACLRRGRSPR